MKSKSASSAPDREIPEAVALIGATASGKTGVGILLAEALRTEILGVDSRQIYRRLAIGTAKPTPAERRRVPHHLVDIVEPDERFSAGRFREATAERLRWFTVTGRTPLFVGGTGLYLRAILEGLCPAPPAAPDLRRWLAGIAASSHGGLHPLLARVDPAAAARIHPHDHYRAVRALEVYFLSGEPLSRRQRSHRGAPPLARTRIFGLSLPGAELERRIARRLDAMVADGFVEEVRRLLADGLDPQLPAMRAVGYPQFIAHVRGEATLAAAVEATRRATRQYARRQLTWFRAVPEVCWIEAGGGRTEASLAEEILQRLRRDGGVPA